MGALVLIPLAALAWLGLVVFFWRAKAWLLYYILGAAGSALLVVVAGRELFPLESLVRQATASSVDFVAPLTGVKTSIEQVNPGSLLVIGVPHRTEWTHLSVGLESSGLLETAALFGLVAFFPAQSLRWRALTVVLAVGLTFLANILRVTMIVAIVGWLGQGWLEFAHIVLGRLVFFALAIGIYWYAITRPTLRAVSRRLAGGNP